MTCLCTATGFERSLFIDFPQKDGSSIRMLFKAILCTSCYDEYKRLQNEYEILSIER